MDHEPLTHAAGRSIARAIADGRLSEEENAAPIAGLLMLAASMDGKQGECSDADVSLYLGYCKALNLLPKPGRCKLDDLELPI